MPPQHIPFPHLPGQLMISRGAWRDYLALARFHYIPKRPATCCGVWTIHYLDHTGAPPRPIGVAVLSQPAPRGRYRRWMMRDLNATEPQQLAFANTHLRTISRVIVHPQFRGIGLATILVGLVLRDAPTRYIEAIARMGHVHPFFEHAGMIRIDPGHTDLPAHFLFDRHHR